MKNYLKIALFLTIGLISQVSETMNPKGRGALRGRRGMAVRAQGARPARQKPQGHQNPVQKPTVSQPSQPVSKPNQTTPQPSQPVSKPSQITPKPGQPKADVQRRAQEQRLKELEEETLQNAITISLLQAEDIPAQNTSAAVVESAPVKDIPAQNTSAQDITIEDAEDEYSTEDEDTDDEDIDDEDLAAAQEESMNYLASTGIHQRTIEGVAIQQLAVQPEDRQNSGLTCGPRSLFIAAALNNLVLSGNEITPETLHADLGQLGYHATIRACRQNYETPSNEFEEFITEHGILNDTIIVLVAQEGMAIPAGTSAEVEANIQYLQGIPDILTMAGNYFRNNVALTPIQFICNTGNHWVLFSVISDEEGRPTVWYVDPMNVNITYRPTLHKYIRYIGNHLGLNQ